MKMVNKKNFIQNLPQQFKPGCIFLVVIMPCLLLQFSSASPNFCYYGVNVNTLGGFQNQSCLDGELHLVNDLQVTDYNAPGSTASPVSRSTGRSANMSADPTPLCYVYRHIVKQTLKGGLEKESVKVEYGCDFKGACLGKDQNKVLNNVTIDEQTGKLYCCSTGNCNTNEKIPHPPAENRLCYSGPVNRSGTLYAELTSCSHPDTICAKSIVFNKDGETPLSEKLYCDETKRCQKYLLSTGAFRSSILTVNKDNRSERLWCCEMQKCFPPQWPILRRTSDGSLVGSGAIENPITNPSEDKGENDLLVAGLISAILLVSVLGGVGIVFLINRNRDRRRDPNVIMQYERLTNSDVDGSEAVIL